MGSEIATANRDRDFFQKGKPISPLFEHDQSLGGWFDQVVEAVLAAGKRVRLSKPDETTIDLQGKDDWDLFFNTYLRAPDATMTDRAFSERLGETLGISLPNLVMFLDDVAVSPSEDKVFDATRNGEVAKAVTLYSAESTYANWTKYSDLYNERPLRALLDPATGRYMNVALVPAIHGRIMDETQGGVFGLDRMEVEAHTDFVYSPAADEMFKRAVSNGPWHGLDLDALDEVDWADDGRVRLLLSYRAPVHLEKRIRDGRPDYRLRDQPFKEIYLETDDGLLAQHSLSLRVRIRPAQDRGLIQMKLELPPNPVTGLPVREKWERRLRGSTYLGDLDLPIGQLLNMTRFGFIVGVGMPELKKLYGILVAAGALPANGELALRPDHVIYQQRLRARLEHDSLEKTKQRRDRLREMAARPAPHPNLLSFIDHVEAQVRAFEACDQALLRHTKEQDQLEGECVLMSWDRWATYEPGGATFGTVPEGLEEPGLRGRGLRAETELDAWTTQPIDEALETIAKKRAGGLEDPAQLDRDEAAIKFWQSELWHDVRLTAEMMRQSMEAAGLQPSADPPSSKSEQAVRMIASGQDGFRRGHRYWW